MLVSIGTPLRAADATEKTAITAMDLFKLKAVETPALSPDGRWVAYVLRSIEPKPDVKDDWVYHTHLWIAATDGSAPPRQLTRGANTNSVPAWHPSGDRIAFVRGGTAPGERAQIFQLFLGGGEAEQLTRLETGAANPRWSPDGRKLLFTSTLSTAQIRDALEKDSKEAAAKWSDERPGRKPNDTANWKLKPVTKPKESAEKEKEAKKAKTDPDGSLQESRDWLSKNESENNPRVTTRANFLAEGDLQTDLSFAQLFVLEVKDGAEPRLVAPAYDARGDAEWLADSRRVVVTSARNASEHPDRERIRSLAIIDTDSGDAKPLLERADENYNNPRPSPDGKWIAFTVQIGGPFSFDQPKVAIVPVAGGEPKLLSAALDRPAQAPNWSHDSRALYFVAATNGGFPLYRVGIDGGEVARLTDTKTGVRDFDVGAERLVFVLTTAENPWELHRADPLAKSPAKLTGHNDWISSRKLSAYEERSFTNKDGLTIQYWLIKPSNFDAAKKYPLLVQIHGGPSAMWGPGEQSMWHEFQFYAAKGYGVVFSNPRGSGGYGRDFQRANHRNWGAGPAADVLTAADFAAKESWVDADRQFLTGGSYGGYLTAWIIAHDHRFKAAVAQRGVYDLTTFFGEGNAWFLVPLYFGGYPWEPDVRRVLERESPLTHVANIKTPLLIQHGDVDFRTGVIQSQMLFKSLKTLNRPVEYVRYPRATHEMSRSGEPKHRLDSLVRYEEFFRRYGQTN